MKVNECMSQDVCFVKPDCRVYDVARIMCENHIGCVPICNDNRNVIGLVTDRDILIRTVACDKDVKSTNVSDIMTTDVCTCEFNQTINDAQFKMAKNQIRRIPVVDEKNQMVGILTMGDLARETQKIGQQNVSNTIQDICNCEGKIKNYS